MKQWHAFCVNGSASRWSALLHYYSGPQQVFLDAHRQSRFLLHKSIAPFAERKATEAAVGHFPLLQARV
jgi:hypothetical protein